MTQGFPKNAILATSLLRDLMMKIEAGDPEAESSLHAKVSPGLRFLLSRRLGNMDLDRIIADIECEVIHLIQEHEDLTEEHLAFIVRDVMCRKVSEARASLPIEADQESRQSQELLSLKTEQEEEDYNVQELAKVLSEIPPREYDFLKRRYLNSQSATEIKCAMSLTDAEYENHVARARKLVRGIAEQKPPRKNVNAGPSRVN